ncbi:MAG: Transglycosylase domain protein [Candidatus Saccharibacteria bacterium]|jgi:hypothetical protein|nr:Transglycosylase domain protein [Candidatus Saccharibacteria bacterium]
MVLLASQVNALSMSSITAVAESQTQANGAYEVKLNTNTASAVEIVGAKRPDYEAEVLAPLKAAQAAAAKKAATKRTVRRTPVVIPGSDVWAKLRYCESGGDYTKNTGNGYYGAYQYSISTWANYKGYARPDLAPPAIQDEKAKITQAARGWYPWPGCARKLGLI